MSGTKELLRYGRCAWGSWQHQLESVAALAGDARWEGGIAVDTGTGVAAAISVHRARFPRAAAAFLGPAVQIAPGPTVFLGGPARMLGGAAVRQKQSPREQGAALAALLDFVRTTLIKDQTDPIAALMVPEQQLPYFLSLMHRPEISLGGVRSRLNCHGATSVDEFVARLPSKLRNIWANDAISCEKAGFRAEVGLAAPEDESWLDASADLIASVERRNGSSGAVPLTRLRLRRWLERGSAYALSVEQAGRLVGIALARVDDTTLVVDDIGMADDVDHRHSLYTELLFRVPLRLAIEHGCQQVDLGVGHELVKRQRGARQEALWDVVGAMHGLAGAGAGGVEPSVCG